MVEGQSVNSRISNDNQDCDEEIKHVFIIGSKGIPASYGGYETFVEFLTKYRVNSKIMYHVARFSKDNSKFTYNGAEVFNCRVSLRGPEKAIVYDLKALKFAIKYCKTHLEIKKPIFYVLACRIGPFFKKYVKSIHKLGGRVYVNPDGHEWLRAKWPKIIRQYWKVSERLMVKHSDLLICDSKNIEYYIHQEYSQYNPKTTYIAYGSSILPSRLSNSDDKFVTWLNKHDLQPFNYYLVVGRFVPENNYETMIREFLMSKSNKHFVIITNVNKKFLSKLEKKLHFSSDSRIKFVGTVYDSELLKKIRENAYAYFHGHEVGGTNPSLLEALSSTNLNLLLDVGFNREVAGNAACYWCKQKGNLSELINKCDGLSINEIVSYGDLAKKRIQQFYTWDYIVSQYEDVFLNR